MAGGHIVPPPFGEWFLLRFVRFLINLTWNAPRLFSTLDILGVFSQLFGLNDLSQESNTLHEAVYIVLSTLLTRVGNYHISGCSNR